jgi:urease accessory protein
MSRRPLLCMVVPPKLPIFDELVVHAATVTEQVRCIDTLVLPFELRQRARLRATCQSGREIGVHLPRGSVLRGGNRLRGSDGDEILVIAAEETVSTVHCDSSSRLVRIAYHLGNRHVNLEVGEGWVRYARDHVLDAMVAQLGGTVRFERAPFEPEAGAYAGGVPHAH